MPTDSDARRALQAQVQVDSLCEEFEDRWLAGTTPQIEEFLDGAGPDLAPELLLELLRIDLEFRAKNGSSGGDVYQALMERFGELVQQALDEWQAAGARSVMVGGEAVGRDEPAKSGGASVRIRIVAGPHQGEEFCFDSHQTLVVGRAADAQWRITKDSSFSRYHFRIETKPPVCRLIDLDSSNGTFVNRGRIRDVYLHDGDQIECGITRFLVSIDQPATTGFAARGQFGGDNLAEASVAEVELPPRELAEFEITRELGRGVMGVVYHAVQRASGREAAIKIIRPRIVADEREMHAFLREASILSQLKHRRIVEYISLGIHERRLYFAMEYLQVLDFQATLARQSRPKQIQLACAAICNVLEALEFAHRAGVVHRDVKPSNILAYPVGKKVGIKLADFGLARNYLEAGFSSLGNEPEVRSTFYYTAPEQLIDCRIARPAGDVYACGACLYHFLCGRPPFDSDDTPSAMGQILNSTPPLADRAGDLPRELALVVERALARDPQQRFESAESMRLALLPFAVKRPKA